MKGIIATAVLAFAVPSLARASDDVPVKIAGGHDMVLERAIEGTGLWESLCVGVCNAKVPWNGWYRVTGHGLRPSMPIGLVTARDGAVHLEPHPAYTSGFLGGIALSIVGPLVFLGGVISIAADNRTQFAPGFQCPGCPMTEVPPPSNAPIIGGALAMGIGGVMTLVGVLITTLSHHTSVSQIAVSGRSVTLTF
jgi:hypothetical protein